MDTISFEDFKKVDMRIGTIKSCELVPDTDRLFKLNVDFGALGTKQIIAGLAKWYDCSELINKQFAFVLNLEPKVLKGFESQGMILAAGLSNDEKPYLLTPTAEVENGEGIR